MNKVDEIFKRAMEKHGKTIAKTFRAYCETEALKQRLAETTKPKG